MKMEKLKINLKKIKNKEIADIAAHFERGLVVAYPSDTIYGLGCDAANKTAINRIYKIKKRSRKKPLLILVGSLAMLKKYFYVNKRQYEYVKNLWQGKARPTSVILDSRGILPQELSEGTGVIAVRLPKSEFLIKIIKRIGAPLVSTSLNKSGQEPKEDVSNLEKYFGKEKPDLVIDAGILKGKPSRLIDIRDVENIKILRK